MRLFLRFDELSGDAQAIALATHVALDKIVGAQRAADFGGAATLALRALDGCTRDDADRARAQLHQLRDRLLGEPVREAVVGPKRKHGEPRAVRAMCAIVAGRGTASKRVMRAQGCASTGGRNR